MSRTRTGPEPARPKKYTDGEKNFKDHQDDHLAQQLFFSRGRERHFETRAARSLSRRSIDASAGP
jgi:hypothetical protein